MTDGSDLSPPELQRSYILGHISNFSITPQSSVFVCLWSTYYVAPIQEKEKCFLMDVCFSFLYQALWRAMGRPGSSSDDLHSPPWGILGWGRRASRSESRRKLIFWWKGSGTHMVGHGVCACCYTLHTCNEAVRGVRLLHQIYDPRSGRVAAVSARTGRVITAGSRSVKGTVTVWRDKCRRPV